MVISPAALGASIVIHARLVSSAIWLVSQLVLLANQAASPPTPTQASVSFVLWELRIVRIVVQPVLIAKEALMPMCRVCWHAWIVRLERLAMSLDWPLASPANPELLRPQLVDPHHVWIAMQVNINPKLAPLRVCCVTQEGFKIPRVKELAWLAKMALPIPSKAVISASNVYLESSCQGTWLTAPSVCLAKTAHSSTSRGGHSTVVCRAQQEPRPSEARKVVKTVKSGNMPMTLDSSLAYLACPARIPINLVQQAATCVMQGLMLECPNKSHACRVLLDFLW
jgi:hypothetical protein